MACEDDANWCAWIVGTIAVIGTGLGIIYRLSQGPRRAEVVLVEERDGWTGRLMRIGPWDEAKKTWTGRSKFEVEIMDPDNSVQRIDTNIPDPERAREFMRQRLARAVRRAARDAEAAAAE